MSDLEVKQTYSIRQQEFDFHYNNIKAKYKFIGVANRLLFHFDGHHDLI